ncbi:MAG: SRPBCC family protein [Myxococcota bacterium]
MSLTLVRTWSLPFSHAQLWEALSQPGQLRRWWLPLERFEPHVGGACQLEAGAALGVLSAQVMRFSPGEDWQLDATDGSWRWRFELLPTSARLAPEFPETTVRCTLQLQVPGAEVWAESWQTLVLIQLHRQLEEKLHVPTPMDFTRTHEPLIWLGTTISSPARPIWQALTDSAIFNTFSGIELKLRLEEGARMLLRWPPRSGPEVEPGTVLSFKKDRVLVFRMPSSMLGASKVTWSLMPSGGEVELELLHEEYPAEMETLGWRLRWMAFVLRVQAFVESKLILPPAERLAG